MLQPHQFLHDGRGADAVYTAQKEAQFCAELITV